MLTYLAIDNYVLLKKVRLNFDTNFIAISGETGSGKSLLLETLNLITGGKLSKNVNGPITISACYDISNNNILKKVLLEKNIEISDDTLIVKRVIKENNKSYFYLQGMPIKISEVIEISNLLIHIAGQNSNAILYKSESQIQILDNYINQPKTLEKVKSSFFDYKQIEEQVIQVKKDVSESQERIAYLSFIAKELNSANLDSITEDIEILDTLNKIKDSSKIFKSLKQIQSNYKSNNEYSVQSRLKEMSNQLRKLEYLNNPFDELSQRLESITLDLEDIVSECEDQLDDLSYSESEVDELNSRLSKLQNLMRLYGPTLENVIKKRDEVNKSLDDVENAPDLLSKLNAELADKKKIYEKECSLINHLRIDSAKKLEKQLTNSLKELDMRSCDLKIEVTNGKETSLGTDIVNFIIKTNEGTTYAKLEEIASGGEISRILLAILSVLSEKDNISTIIFDEIDTGIGGKISHSVANKLKHISENKQVIVVTHLATVASKAKQHVLINKSSNNNSTTSSALLIDKEARVVEIARMLSGHSLEEEALSHARMLLDAKV